MFFVLLLIFIVIPVVELSVLIQVGGVLGSLTTVGLVIFTAVVGVSLVRSQGLSTLMQAQEKMARGEAPTGELVEGMMLAMAGVLLLIPGFVTDFIGLLLLTPITRKPLAAVLQKRLQFRVMGNGGFGGQGHNPFGGQSPFGGHNPFGGNTFEGDFERKEEPVDSSKRLDNDEAKPTQGETRPTEGDDEQPRR